MIRRQITTEQISSCRSHWNRKIENAENASSHPLGEQVGYERRRDGYKGSFPHTHQRVSDQQFSVGVGHCREQGERAPEQCTQDDDELARIAVGQRPYEGRRDHVEPEKGAGQIANLGIRQVKLVLHQRLHREQHIAVRIVEQIERSQDNQRRARVKVVLSHKSSEYSTADRFTPLPAAATSPQSWLRSRRAGGIRPSPPPRPASPTSLHLPA